jgi:hypothetical protein
MFTPTPPTSPPPTTPRVPPPPPPPPAFVPPRTGGGYDRNSVWTGGTVLKPVAVPKSTMAYRPVTYNDARKLEKDVVEKLTLVIAKNAGAGNLCTLPEFIDEFKITIVDRGLDGVFSIYDADTNTEKSILDEYGFISSSKAAEWVKSLLQTGVRMPDGKGGFYNLPPCPYDALALAYAGKILKASIDPALWQTIKLKTKGEPDGVTLFMATVFAINGNSSAVCRSLVEQLRKKSLAKWPGQNVLTFIPQITSLARQIASSPGCPNDLDALFLTTLMGSSCVPFALKVNIEYNNAIEDDGTHLGWELFAISAQDSYTTHIGLELWPAAATTKAGAAAQTEEVTLLALTASLNALAQKIDSAKAGTPATPGTPGTPGTRTTPRGRGGADRDRDPAKFRQIPPADGEPHIKVFEGKTYTWCSKCGWWTVGSGMHNGDTHRSRAEVAAAKEAAGPASAPGAKIVLAAVTPAITSAPASTSAVTFSSDTKLQVAADTNHIPPKSRLQMIRGLMNVASGFCAAIPDEVSSEDTPPPPPTVPPLSVHEQSSDLTLGVCPVCNGEGPEDELCSECENEYCRYEVHRLGSCVVCGEEGPVGLYCTDCEDTGAIYDSVRPDSPPEEVEVLSRLLERLPASLIAAAATSTAPLETSNVEHSHAADSHNNDDDNNNDDNGDDDASFASAVSRVSSSSEPPARLAGSIITDPGTSTSTSGFHLNYFAGQDST